MGNIGRRLRRIIYIIILEDLRGLLVFGYLDEPAFVTDHDLQGIVDLRFVKLFLRKEGIRWGRVSEIHKDML